MSILDDIHRVWNQHAEHLFARYPRLILRISPHGMSHLLNDAAEQPLLINHLPLGRSIWGMHIVVDDTLTGADFLLCVDR